MFKGGKCIEFPYLTELFSSGEFASQTQGNTMNIWFWTGCHRQSWPFSDKSTCWIRKYVQYSSWCVTGFVTGFVTVGHAQLKSRSWHWVFLPLFLPLLLPRHPGRSKKIRLNSDKYILLYQIVFGHYRTSSLVGPTLPILPSSWK